ncbi:MAG TPA: hypothetical protein VGE39_02500 [Prosthecobacter sp.]
MGTNGGGSAGRSPDLVAGEWSEGPAATSAARASGSANTLTMPPDLPPAWVTWAAFGLCLWLWWRSGSRLAP